jgi:hypothetical protein
VSEDCAAHAVAGTIQYHNDVEWLSPRSSSQTFKAIQQFIGKPPGKHDDSCNRCFRRLEDHTPF